VPEPLVAEVELVLANPTLYVGGFVQCDDD